MEPSRGPGDREGEGRDPRRLRDVARHGKPGRPPKAAVAVITVATPVAAKVRKKMLSPILPGAFTAETLRRRSSAWCARSTRAYLRRRSSSTQRGAPREEGRREAREEEAREARQASRQEDDAGAAPAAKKKVQAKPCGQEGDETRPQEGEGARLDSRRRARLLRRRRRRSSRIMLWSAGPPSPSRRVPEAHRPRGTRDRALDDPPVAARGQWPHARASLLTYGYYSSSAMSFAQVELVQHEIHTPRHYRALRARSERARRWSGARCGRRSAAKWNRGARGRGARRDHAPVAVAPGLRRRAEA